MDKDVTYETFLYLSNKKFILCVIQDESKIVYEERKFIENDTNSIEFKKLSIFLDNNIFKIEKRIKDFIKDISQFMFSFVPEEKVDIDEFIHKANETTLNLLKTNDNFRADYVLNAFMKPEEKVKDLEYLINYFEAGERYEDCAVLLKIKNKIIANDEFAKSDG